MAIGKRLKKAREGVDREKLYPLADAIKMVKERAKSKFDETIEIAINLGVDPRHADQMVRGVVNLPNGTGRTLRVGVFARGAKAEEAKAAGADVVGAEDLVERAYLDLVRVYRPNDRVFIFGFSRGAAITRLLARVIDARGARYRTLPRDQMIHETARQMNEEQAVIGWFQGRMEWGPRALGNRSIVCEPRRADMKDILNRKIKRRESFRPFAPSVIRVS